MTKTGDRDNGDIGAPLPQQLLGMSGDCTGATRPHTHSCSHQASRRSSCCSTIWLHSKSLLSHRPSKISRSRISLKHKHHQHQGALACSLRQVLSPNCGQAGTTAPLVKQTSNQHMDRAQQPIPWGGQGGRAGTRLWAEGEGDLSHLSGIKNTSSLILWETFQGASGHVNPGVASPLNVFFTYRCKPMMRFNL